MPWTLCRTRHVTGVASRRWRATRFPRMNGTSERTRTVTGAVAAARIWFVAGFCVAASVVEACLDTAGRDPNMVIAPDIESQILSRHHADKWRVGTIAQQLHVHHSVVRRVLAQAGLPQAGAPPRPSQIDVYLPFIRLTLETFPTLTASRLYAMAREPGYRGSPDHFRHLIARHRPPPKAPTWPRRKPSIRASRKKRRKIWRE